MIEAVRFNLANLVNFSGRDSRSTFWFYLLFLTIVHFVTLITFYLVIGGGLFASLMQEARAGGLTTDAAVQASVGLWVSRLMGSFIWFTLISAVVGSALVGASFTRRLHDSGKPGWIAGIVFALHLVSAVFATGAMRDYALTFQRIDLGNAVATQQLMASTQQSHALTGLLGWIPLIALLVFGIWPSSDGDNRYGPEPEHL